MVVKNPLNQTQGTGPRLVVVACDPIETYERAGYDWLERYFNPTGLFSEVYALSPLEQGIRKAHGMTILGVPEQKFDQALKKIRPDVVRAYGGFWPSDLVCRNRRKGIPVIVSIHDVRPSLIHRSVCFADLVLCVTQAVERQVLAIGVEPARIRRLPNRVDTKVFYPIKDKGLFEPIAQRFPEGRHILHVGRRAPEKNLDTLIRSLPMLSGEYSCVFVGAGDRTPFVSLAERLGVSDRCFWVDAVKNSELPLWYSWCDCFCLPSRFEGFGIVALEAAACGTPMVVSDIPALREYLTHNESACLVKEYENPVALSNAIRRVCEDQDYRSTLLSGVSTVAKQFDVTAIDKMEADIYREAMKMKSLPLQRRLDIKSWNFREAVGERLDSVKSRLKAAVSAAGH